MDLYPVVNFNQYYADNSRLHWVNPNFTTVNDKVKLPFVGSREIYKLPFSVVVGTAVSRDIRDDALIYRLKILKWIIRLPDMLRLKVHYHR